MFLSPVVDIFSYSALLASPAPSTDLDKLNEWMDGVGGIAARAGICVCPWMCKMLLPFSSEANGSRFINRKRC